MGGRQVRQDADQLFDHYGAEYTFADGARFIAYGRHMANCFDYWGAIIHGAKGSGIMGEGQDDPRLFKGSSWKIPAAPRATSSKTFAPIRIRGSGLRLMAPATSSATTRWWRPEERRSSE